MAFTIHTPTSGIELLSPSGRGEGEIQTVQVFAYRDIISEAGHVEAGKVGYVSRAWINKAISGRCGCKGSPNWFRLI